MRFRLRTLLIVLAIGPPAIAFYYHYLDYLEWRTRYADVIKLEQLISAKPGYHWEKAEGGGFEQVSNTRH